MWANDPVPLYPYPSSPDYRRLWGMPDGRAWERAHDYYLAQFAGFSDIQDGRPLPLHQLQDAGVGNAILYTISQGGCSYICNCALNLEARTAWPGRYDCFTWCRGCQPIQW